jgi:rare lipoprotein A (peptidoglycan hydrolase)
MTKLRILLFAASLMWVSSPMLAATHQAKAQSKLPMKKVVASPSNFKWCDLHACVEPAHYIGTASYYGKEQQGRKMANGQRFDARKLTAACWFLPFGTKVEVLDLLTGRTVMVEITDRGPAHYLHRVIDLSRAAAEKLDFIHEGTTLVLLRPIGLIETTSAVFPTLIEGPQKDENKSGSF